MLGFKSHHELDSNGDDLYTQELNNLHNTGDLLDFSNGIRPYRFPNFNIYNYIFLCINDYMNIVDLNINNNIFAKIQLIDERISTDRTWSPYLCLIPIVTLDSLKIKFIDYAGNLIDFQDINHSFTLEIIELQEILVDVNKNTRRGDNDIAYNIIN
jgi:hypothetical protein